jgi:predicted esterase
MRKIFLLLAILTTTFYSFAQGPQQQVSVPYPTGNLQGYLYLPADYPFSTTKYPVVIFLHGLGEAGAFGPVNILLNQGIPNLIANGMRPDNITDPISKKKFSFIVIATQHYDWAPPPEEVLATIKWVIANYRVDISRIYINGLSAGGAETVDALTYSQELTHYFAAAVPMSIATNVNPSDAQLQAWATEKIHTWCMDGDQDGDFLTQTKWINSRFNQFFPNSSELWIYPGGHCCWTTYEDINWHSPTTGLSMWEWMLQYQKGIPLPITFGDFYLRTIQNSTLVHWTTVSESNNAYFEVQRSEDGISFNTVGKIDSKAPNGNSSATLTYDFTFNR